MTEWTTEQNAIFASSGPALISALAGTGKTTTIVEYARRFRERNKYSAVQSLVFTRANQQQMEEKLGKNGQSSTFNSYGYHLVREHFPRIKINRDKRLISKEIIGGWPTLALYTSDIRSAIEWAMNVGIGPKQRGQLIAACAASMAGKKNITKGLIEQCALAASEMLSMLVQENWIYKKGVEFGHSLYLPWYHNLVPEYPAALGLIDEAQDMSPTQKHLAMYCAHQLGIVGDENQSIYGWRGAEPGVMRDLGRATDAEQFELNISFRCAKLIAQEARRYVPRFKPFRREMGVVDWKPLAGAVTKLQPGDAVISRTNASLVPVWVYLIKQNVPCRIVGRKLIGDLKKLLKGIGTDNMGEACKLAGEDLAARIKDKQDSGLDAAYDIDLHDVMIALQDSFKNDSVSRILSLLEMDRIEGVEQVELSTVHQAKGLEWKNVLLVWNSFRAHDKLDAAQEERNLEYVAVTRARDTLIYGV